MSEYKPRENPNIYQVEIRSRKSVLKSFETRDLNDILKSCRTYYKRGISVKGYIICGVKEVLFADYTQT